MQITMTETSAVMDSFEVTILKHYYPVFQEEEYELFIYGHSVSFFSTPFSAYEYYEKEFKLTKGPLAESADALL